MRAVVVPAPGGPESLVVQDITDPVAGPGQVLVRVEAAGVNFIDTYRRSGVYPMQYPHVVGSEGAGMVVALGDGAVTGDLRVGARVAWKESAGSYAELAVVDADELVPVPDGVTTQTAAAVMLQGLTAHYLARSTYAIAPGEHVLVHAAAGGVGLLLTQLAAMAGAHVIGTSSSDAKAELAREAGAEHVVRYDQLADLTLDLPTIIRELTDGGAHVVYDGVGKSTFDASLASLRRRGMLVLFGGSSGQVPPVDLQRLNSGGSLFATRPTLKDYVVARADLLWRAEEIFADVASGALKVRIGGTYRLAEAGTAHADLESRRTTGKLLVLPGE